MAVAVHSRAMHTAVFTRRQAFRILSHGSSLVNLNPSGEVSLQRTLQEAKEVAVFRYDLLIHVNVFEFLVKSKSTYWRLLIHGYDSVLARTFFRSVPTHATINHMRH